MLWPVITIAMATAVLLLALAQPDDRVAPAAAPPHPRAVAAEDPIAVAGGSHGATAAGSVAASTPRAAGSAPTHQMNVYAHDGANMLTGAARRARSLIYVPNSGSNTVDVINPATRRVIRQFPVGLEPQHVVPSWDLKRLYVTNDQSNTLTPINPVTGRPGRPIPVADPYNLYFTPDGRSAVVMAERLGRMDFYDPKTWQQQRSVPVPCRGVNHADWSVDGRWFVVTCEFSGQLLQVDSGTGRVLRTIALPSGSMPQDIRLTPDGKQFYVADMMYGGLWTLDAQTLTVGRLIATGKGTHGIYPSRDGTSFYISNRGRAMGDEHRRSHDGDGSVSVVDPGTGSVTATWTIPGGGSPDMGGVSGDGTLLWLSGRYDAEVYAFDTATGRLVARIPVPSGPHGLCVFPQPGRYSLGHTGNDR